MSECKHVPEVIAPCCDCMQRAAEKQRADRQASTDWWDYGLQANAGANACAANQAAQAGPNVPALMARDERIAELEAENAKLREMLSDSAEAKSDLGIGVTAANARASEASARANALADECGRLRDENTQLLAENARLRRGKR